MNNSKCQYYIQIQRCGLDPTIDPKCKGDCSCCSCKGLADALEEGETYPTIQSVVDLYDSVCKKRETQRVVHARLNSVMRLMGCSMSDEFRMLANPAALEDFYERSKGVMADATAIMSVNAIRSLSSRKMSQEGKKRGFRINQLSGCSVPSKIRGCKYERLPNSVSLELASAYDDFLARDHNLWLILVLAWNEGKRMTDVLHTRWSDFIVDGQNVTDVYTPHKTKDSSKEIVHFPIDKITWMRMVKVRDSHTWHDGDFLFKGHNAETAASWPLGDRFNSTIRQRIPYFSKSVKVAHELRKARSQELIDQYGIEEAAKLLGDEPGTLRRFYYDRHHVNVVPRGVGT